MEVPNCASTALESSKRRRPWWSEESWLIVNHREPPTGRPRLWFPEQAGRQARTKAGGALVKRGPRGGGGGKFIQKRARRRRPSICTYLRAIVGRPTSSRGQQAALVHASPAASSGVSCNPPSLSLSIRTLLSREIKNTPKSGESAHRREAEH